MTSYPQSDYITINENDALSYNSQPISNTSHSKSSSKYGNHLDMYDRHGNNGIGSNLSGVHVPPYNMVYGSSSGGFYDYVTPVPTDGSRDQMPITEPSAFRGNDNILYHSNVGGYSDYGGNYDADSGCCDYWDDGVDDAVGGRHTSLGTTKILPQVPMKHSNSMLDGMYISNHHQNQHQYHPHPRIGAALPTTPPVAHKKSRMLPQPGTTAQVCNYGSNSYGFQSKTNGNGTKSSSYNNDKSGFGSACVDAAADVCVAASGMDSKCLPTVPLRVFTQPQLQTQPHSSSYNKHDLYAMTVMQDNKILPDDASMPYTTATYAGAESAMSPITLTTTTSTAASRQKQDTMYGGMNLNDNATISHFNNYTAATSLYSSPSYSYTSTMQRPHSSMAPLNYASEELNYAYNSADSLSTYSEPTTKAASAVAASAVTQLHQQQRKSSIIMAMTTASVIASGETRIAPNLNAQTHIAAAKRFASVRDNRSSSFEYDCTGVAAPKKELFDPATTTDDYFFEGTLLNSGNISNRYVSATPAIATTAATSALPFEKTLTYTSSSNITTSRKLPKLLPTPQLATATTAATTKTTTTTNSTNNSSYLSNSILNNNNNNNNYNSSSQNISNSSISSRNSTKQLPKLSQSKLLTTTATLLAAATAEATTEAIGEATLTTTTTATTAMATYNYTMSSIYTSEPSHQDTTTTISSTSPSSASLFLSYQKASSFSPPINVDSMPYVNKTATTTTTTTTTTVASSTAIQAADTESYVDTTSSNNNFSKAAVDDAVAERKAFTAVPSVLTAIDTASLVTTTTTTATTAASTLAYSDYMKPYTLPTFSAYISKIGRTNELDTFEVTTSQPSSATCTLTTSSLSATTSLFALPTYESNLLSETSTNLDTSLTATTFESPTHVAAVSIRRTSIDKPPYQQHFSSDSFSLEVLSKTFPLSLTTSSSSSSPVRDGAVVWPATTPATFTSSNIPTTTTSTDLGALNFKSEPDTISSFYSLNYPLGTTTTTATVTESTTTWSSSMDSSTKTTTTGLSYNVGLFTTTVSSDTLPACYSTSDSASDNTLTTTMSTTLAPSTELSYDEYMKQFNLDSYTTSPVMFETITTLTTTDTDTAIAKTSKTTPLDSEYAQYASDYFSSDFATKFAPLTDLHIDDVYTTSPATKSIDAATTSVDVTSTVNTTVEASSGFDLATYMSTFSTDSYVEATTEPITVATPTIISTTTAASAFDDSFYDSYKVDLSALTSSTLAEEPTTIAFLDQQQNSLYTTSDFSYLDKLPDTTAYTDYDNSYTQKSSTPIPTTSSTQGGYYQPESSKTAFKPIATTKSATTTTIPTTAETTSTAAGKASSMFGGLSKGIKGGIDGVLSGVSVVTDTNKQQSQQQQQQSTKKGFGFSLASKLVPSVGGLLQSASTLKSQQPTQPTVSVASTTAASSQQTLIPTTSVAIASASTTNSEWNDKSYAMSSSDMPVYTTKSHAGVYDTSSSAYYNDSNLLSSPAVSTVPIYDEEDYEEEQQTDAAQYLSGIKIVDYSTDYKYGYDEYGYSESDYIATGDIMEKTNSYSKMTTSTTYDMSKTGQTALTTARAATAAATTIVPATTWATTVTTAAAAAVPSPPITSSSATASGMASSLLSSLTNAAAAQVQTQQPTSKASTGSGRSSGGMFGSFLGKAAAAVQSATQAVNQGASMATAVVQNVPAAAAAAATLPNTTSASSTTKTTTDSTIFRQHEPIYTPRTTNDDDDYENCNMLEKPNKTTSTQGQINNRNNNFGNNYYEGESHQVILPTVPPAGSTGKKLPTINGKSGYLIKQQPTEIFDDDDDEEDDDDIIDEYVGDGNPVYRMDSEQDDYYMDHQQTTPLSRDTSQELAVAMTTNGYYEHTNGGYDYREDYFNEEDEYKYLEKEQKVQEALLLQQHHQQHTQSLLHQHQKQPPLEYIEESRDDYIDDNYPSEDSGNYLDESSSGSGGGVSGGIGVALSQKIMTDEMAAASLGPGGVPISTSVAAGHQQIKKQDSIILEEDEDEDELLGLKASISGSMSVSNRKSSDILLDDDQMTELPQILQKKKKPILMRGETEEVVGGHMQQMLRKPQVTAKQRWHWAYNKIIMQLNPLQTI